MAKKSFMTNKTIERLFVFSVLAIPILLFILMYVVINFNSILMAFNSTDIYGKNVFVGFDNFKSFVSSVFSNGGILNISIINSLKMYIINLCICMPLYIIFSYLLFKKCVLNKTIRFLVMIPQIVSGMVIALMFKKFVDYALPDIFRQVFNVTTFPELLTDPKYSFGTTLFYMIWISFATSVIVYSNSMNEIPEEIIESAKVDGIDNMFSELRYIILPLIHPTLTTFLITGFSEILTNNGPIMTFFMDQAPAEVYNMGYYYSVQILRGNSASYNRLAAGGILMSLLIAPLTYLLKRILESYWRVD